MELATDYARETYKLRGGKRHKRRRKRGGRCSGRGTVLIESRRVYRRHILFILFDIGARGPIELLDVLYRLPTDLAEPRAIKNMFCGSLTLR